MQNENGKKKVPYKRLDETHIRDYVQVILVRKWLVLLIFLLFIGASILHVIRIPPVYQSQVLLKRAAFSDRTPDTITRNRGTKVRSCC